MSGNLSSYSVTSSVLRLQYMFPPSILPFLKVGRLAAVTCASPLRKYLDMLQTIGSPETLLRWQAPKYSWGSNSPYCQEVLVVKNLPAKVEDKRCGFDPWCQEDPLE